MKAYIVIAGSDIYFDPFVLVTDQPPLEVGKRYGKATVVCVEFDLDSPEPAFTIGGHELPIKRS